jgi:hypothetical protein
LKKRARRKGDLLKSSFHFISFFLSLPYLAALFFGPFSIYFFQQFLFAYPESFLPCIILMLDGAEELFATKEKNTLYSAVLYSSVAVRCWESLWNRNGPAAAGAKQNGWCLYTF